MRVVCELMHATKVGNPNMLISIPLHSAARWEAWEVFITDCTKLHEDVRVRCTTRILLCDK